MTTTPTRARVASIAAAILLLFASGAAMAQTKSEKAATAEPIAPKIAVVNVEYAMREAKAVQSARAQLTVISEKYKKEIDAEETKLRALDQELQQQRAILAPEAFAQKRDEFQQKASSLQQKARALRQAMDQGFKNTMQRIQIVLFEEVAKIADEKGYNLVLPSSQVIVSIGDFNITPQALERLNKRLPDVKLTMEEKTPEDAPGKPSAPAR
jgi:Skp family chaperone for outer membrane proteins